MSDIPYNAPLSTEVTSILVRQHEGALQNLRQWRSNTDMKIVGIEAKIDALHQDMVHLNESVDKLSKRVGWFVMSIAGGSLTFAFSILAATGRI